MVERANHNQADHKAAGDNHHAGEDILDQDMTAVVAAGSRADHRMSALHAQRKIDLWRVRRLGQAEKCENSTIMLLVFAVLIHELLHLLLEKVHVCSCGSVRRGSAKGVRRVRKEREG